MAKREGSKHSELHWTEWKWKYNILKFVGCSSGSDQREIYSTKWLEKKKVLKTLIKSSPQEPRKKKSKISSKQAEGRK